MGTETMKAAPHHKGTASGIAKHSIARIPEDSRPLPEIQTDFLAARYGLDAALFDQLSSQGPKVDWLEAKLRQRAGEGER